MAEIKEATDTMRSPSNSTAKNGPSASSWWNPIRELWALVVLFLLIVQLAVPAGAQTAQPARPVGLVAEATAHNKVSLSWDDPGDASIVGYKVLRRDRDVDAPGVFAVIDGDTGSASVVYTDTTVEPEKRYVYRVVAVNGQGDSPRSSYVNVDTPEQPEEPDPEPEPEPDPEPDPEPEESEDPEPEEPAEDPGDVSEFVGVSGVVWSAVMVVDSGVMRDVVIDGVLFVEAGPVFGHSFGMADSSLSETDFEVGGESHRVWYLLLMPESSRLYLGMRQALDPGVVFEVAGGSFRVGDAALFETPPVPFVYVWDAPGVELTAGAETIVTLSVPEPESSVPNSEPTGRPVISGVDGQPTTLQASVAGISDDDGLEDAVFEYEWLGLSGLTATVVDEATEASYTPDLTDGYGAYVVRVSYIDGGGNQETLTSAATPIRQHVVDHANLLPDLRSVAPDNAGLFTRAAGSVRLLPVDGSQTVTTNSSAMLLMGFASDIPNYGDGPLDVVGNPQLADPADPTSHDAWQRTPTDDGEWVKLTRPPLRYETADNHSHFHLMRLAEYSLWNVAGTERIAVSPKVGFCLVDIDRIPGLPVVWGFNNRNKYWTSCSRSQSDSTSLRMGITEGFFDRYSDHLPFQWVDVSDVPPGRYRLAAQTDPDDVIWESDETNNGVVRSSRVTIVPGYIAEPSEVTTSSGTAVEVPLNSRRYGDPGTLRFTVVDGPANGTVNVDAQTTLGSETVTYTPNDGFVGSDTFEFEAFDTWSEFPRTPVRATVTITVEEGADGPPQQDPGNNQPSLTPLTAVLEQVPQTHDGSSAFSVELIFSQEIPIGYVTVRDSVFCTTGGTVISASRKSRASNRGWVVRIQPDGDDDVEIVASSSGLCNRISSSDTSRLEAVVRGPS